MQRSFTIQKASRWFGKPFFYAIVLCAGLFTTLAGGGCQRKTVPTPEKTMTTTPAPTSPAPEKTVQPAPVAAPTIVATLQRTSCYGACPVFTATVYSNGTARWQGVEHVPYKGNYRVVLPDNWTTQLFQEAERIGFFTLLPHYPQQTRVIADLPMVVTFLQRNVDTRNRVENRGDAPIGLQRFEQYFESQLMSLPWQREEGIGH